MQRILARLALPGEGLKPVVILDAGFASAANLELLRNSGYAYLVNITRGSRKKYADEFAATGFELLPDRAENQQVEVRKITDPEDPASDDVLKTDHSLDGAALWKLYMTLLRAEEGFSSLQGALGCLPHPEIRHEMTTTL